MSGARENRCSLFNRATVLIYRGRKNQATGHVNGKVIVAGNVMLSKQRVVARVGTRVGFFFLINIDVWFWRFARIMAGFIRPCFKLTYDSVKQFFLPCMPILVRRCSTIIIAEGIFTTFPDRQCSERNLIEES